MVIDLTYPESTPPWLQTTCPLPFSLLGSAWFFSPAVGLVAMRRGAENPVVWSPCSFCSHGPSAWFSGCSSVLIPGPNGLA